MLTFILLCSACALFIDGSDAVSDDNFDDGYFSYILNEDGDAILTAFENKDKLTSIEIPSTCTDSSSIVHTVVEIRGGISSELLTEVIIPASITEISNTAFNESNNIKSFAISGVSSYYEVDDGVLYTKGLHKLVKYPNGKESSPGVRATSYVVSTSTSEICLDAFSHSSLVNVEIPGNALVKIGDGAFSYCPELTTINFPPSLSIIASSAFYQCEKLASINLPEELNMIGSSAFAYTAISTVFIPYGVNYIGGAAFSNCSNLTSFSTDSYYFEAATEGPDAGILFETGTKKKLVCYPSNREGDSYTVPENTEISPMAFSGCKNLKTLNFPKGLTTIPELALYECYSLENVDLSNISIIGGSSFTSCTSLKTVDLPENLLYIGAGAFFDSGLTEITIPSNVATIESTAFGMCNSLTKVTFAESSKATLGRLIFMSDFNLKEIVINSSDVVLTEDSLSIGNEEAHATVDVYVKQGYKVPADAYYESTTTLNIKTIGERPYPWVNIVGAVVCGLGIIGILYGMRQV